MKRPTLISLSLFAVISFSAIVSVANLPSGFRFFTNIIADDNPTTITLDNEHKPVIDGENASFEWNQYTTLTYKNVTAYDDGHIELLPGGSILKDNESEDNVSNGLQSITATFAGDLRIQTSYQEGGIDYVYTLTSGAEKQIEGNYFKILTYDGAKIDNLELSFGCVSSAFVDGGNEYKEQLDSFVIVNPVAGGTETMSINSFNFTFEGDGLTANVVDVDEHPELYIMMEEGKSKTISSSNTLDFSNLDQYNQVVVTGGGELEFEVASGDGLVCNDFVVEYGTTLKLSRTETSGTGIKPLKTLRIYGNLEITKYNHGIGLNTSNTSIEANIEKSGLLSVYDCGSGCTAWNKASSTNTTTVNIKGTAEIKNVTNGFKNSGAADIFTVNITGKVTINCTDDGVSAANSFNLHFKDSSKTTIITTGTDKAGINMVDGYEKLTFVDSSTVTITSNNGYGIVTNAHSEFRDHSTVNINAKIGLYHSNGNNVYFRDYSTVNIQSTTGNGIFGCRRICVFNGTLQEATVNHASLSVKSSGNDMIHMQDGKNVGLYFHTLGKVNIEYTGGGISKTGIHFGDNVTSTSIYSVKCADFTFKNLSNCWGKWKNITVTVTYEYDGNFNKIKAINCNNIYNSGNGNSTAFGSFDGNVERITE